MKTPSATAAARYDDSFRHAWRSHTPLNYPTPQPSSAWPTENIVLLDQYRDWLLNGGIGGATMIDLIYIPIAGYVLGLNLKPYTELNLDTDFQSALNYLDAKRLSVISTKIRRNALEKFCLFLRQRRGQHIVTFRPPNYARYSVGLPDWWVKQLERYQHLMQSHWRPARLTESTLRFWGGHTRLWRWLFEHYPINQIADIKRSHLLDYVDYRLAAGSAASSVNQDLRYFHAFLLFLQDQEYRVPQALLRVPVLKEPEPLPRFLTDEQVRLLRDDFEHRVKVATTPSVRRDAQLDRATFYLMWQGGLRLGEVEELRLDDLDLAGRKLMVRQGKGLKDRAIYLTDTTVQVLQNYLTMRGAGPTDHVFLYRHKAVNKDLIGARIRYCGQRTGVAVSPHRLRHTCATQLLNAGCRVTSIQKLLGHRQLGTTMIYAKAHDKNVSADYYTAMARIETRLELDAGLQADEPLTIHPFMRTALLSLANHLAEPQLEVNARLELVKQMRGVLEGKRMESVAV